MGPELGVGPAGVSLVDARLKGRHRQSWQVARERGEPDCCCASYHAFSVPALQFAVREPHARQHGFWATNF